MKSNALINRPSKTYRTNMRNHSYYQHVPRVNVYMHDDAYLFELAVPGLKKDDIKITINDRTLTIKHEAPENQKREYLKKSFDLNGFERSFKLNKDIDPQAISAKQEDGLLKITLPLAERSKPQQVHIV